MAFTRDTPRALGDFDQVRPTIAEARARVAMDCRR
jgi:hypothetical protein